MKKLLCLIALFGVAYANPQESEGQILNPMTEICWKCAFPIQIPGDGKIPSACVCLKDGTVGVPLKFWEPAAIVEVTRTPYKFVSLNLDLSPKSARDRGGVRTGGTSESSFYHVHYIPFPVFRALAAVPGFECMKEWKEVNPPWCSEWDPSWKHPELAKIFTDPDFDHSPEMIARCSEDCREIKNGKETDKYWWCAGCLGSVYPLSGHVAHHVSPLKSSALLVYRMLGKIHTIRWWAMGPNGYDPEDPQGGWCGRQSLRRMPKTFYKMQLLRPVAIKRCFGLGEPTESWGKKTTMPLRGEDFAYLVWNEKRCCFNPASSALTGYVKEIVDKFDGGLKQMKEEIEKMPRFFKFVFDPVLKNDAIQKTEAVVSRVKDFTDRFEPKEDE